jgi:hypothetical protein
MRYDCYLFLKNIFIDLYQMEHPDKKYIEE